MSKRWILALGALALCLSTVVWGDNNVLSKGTYYQNATNGAKTNSTGDAAVVEQSPAMDANLTLSLINDATGLKIGEMDSSTVKDTHKMRLGTLLIKPFPGSGNAGTTDTTTVWRLAVQIRTHLNGIDDSLSTFPIYQYGKSDLAANMSTSAMTDSTEVGQIVSNSNLTAVSATVTEINAYSGEFIVKIVGKRFAHGASINVNGHPHYYPNGIAIPLSSLFGRDIYSPYTSVRIRVATAQTGAASATTAQLGFIVSLVGTPL